MRESSDVPSLNQRFPGLTRVLAPIRSRGGKKKRAQVTPSSEDQPSNGAPMSWERTPKRSIFETVVAAGACHWLIVAILTIGGLLVAELPILPRIRDRVYMWLQWEIHRPEKRVIVVVIDNEEFWRGEPAGIRPLNRLYLADLLRRLATGDPDVLALDIGLETAVPRHLIEHKANIGPTLELLNTIDSIAQKCPVVLPKTISHPKAKALFRPEHDVYDTFRFKNASEITFGHTSSAQDIRQIPTRVRLDNGELLDSFALAIFRSTTRGDVPPSYEDPNHAWPYSLFLPEHAFVPRSRRDVRPVLLTPSAIRNATPKQLRKWLRGQIVIVGGAWHETAHGGNTSKYVDGRMTPLGWMPGVLTHANYVQSLLWQPMFPMPDGWRIGIEILLSLGISSIFLRARRWRRACLIVVTIGIVMAVTWVFRAAVGVFFDLVIPVTFLGVHVLCEEIGERVAFVPRRPIRHGRRTLIVVLALTAITLCATLIIRESGRVHHQLTTEQRLQVTDVSTATSPFATPTQDWAALARAALSPVSGHG